MAGTSHPQELLGAVTVVLSVAAVTTVLFVRLRQPVVLGYVLAGLIVGPHVPIPLVADPEIVQTLSELGVVLLMFSLGLEFSFGKLAAVGATAGVTAVIQCGLMIWLGFLTAQAFGWTTVESLFAGALISVSSTTIIAKAFDEQGIRGRLRELVVGILIVEDLIAVVLMAALTAVASGSGLDARALASTTGRLVAFLVVLTGGGLLVVPRLVRSVVRLGRAETLIVTSVGLCFLLAYLAHAFGYSVALGAFLAGTLVAESGEAKRVEHLVEPVRDVFAAIFFVSVGMMIDPVLVAEHWAAVLVFTVVVVVGKLVSVSFGAFVTGAGVRTSVQAGLSLAQIGEFSFIIAGLGLTLGATRSFLYPVAVAVSAVTTLTTPWLIRSADAASRWVDRTLPAPLQTVAALYGSWIESLGRRSSGEGVRAQVRRLVRRLVLDAALLALVVIGGSLSVDRLGAALAEATRVEQGLARIAAVVGIAFVAAPFCLGVVRVSRALGLLLAESAFPASGTGVDAAAAPRRSLSLALQLVVFLAVGAPLLAVTQPFVGGPAGGVLLLALAAPLAYAFWKSATDLHGHVRAGAEIVVEAFAKARGGAQAEDDSAARLRTLLPGLGDPTAARVEPGSAAADRSLAAVNLRGRTGATVLAIVRGEEALRMPGADEVLRPGDLLALAGSQEAIDAARALVAAPPPVPQPMPPGTPPPAGPVA